MSYNTRRQGGPPQAASNVAQRRPNFVPGGQQMPNQQPRTPNPQQKPQQAAGNFRNQQQQQSFQGNFQSTPQKQAPQIPQNQQQGNTTPAKAVAAQATPKPTVAPPAPVQAPPQAPAAPMISDESEDTFDSSSGQKKNFRLNKTKGPKISRSEKVRRRNLRLSKLLQPKNAVMILNELVKGCVYTTDELPVKLDSNQFRGTVCFEGMEFAGTGRTKIAAKNAAAEVALKHLVKNKQLIKSKKDEDGDENMEVDSDTEGVMPWSHIASFAMYKLFATWGEDPNIVAKPETPVVAAVREPKPARKMPENPETINPLMLMHQMMPQAVWQEVGKSGNPPNVVFTFNVNIDGKTYTGCGNSKKTAKKLAAFAACHEALNVTYPPDVWTPLY